VAAVAALERAARLSHDPVLRGGRLLRAAELAFELGRREVVVGLLAQADQLELSPQQRWRLAWIRDSFDDGIQDHTGARLLARLAERAAAEDPDLAWTSSTARACGAGGPSRARRRVRGSSPLPSGYQLMSATRGCWRRSRSRNRSSGDRWCSAGWPMPAATPGAHIEQRI
jgi:hypothetical protein